MATMLEQRAIDAVFVEAVAEATRTAELQRLGELPVPRASRAAYQLLGRVTRRRLGLDPRELRDSLAPDEPRSAGPRPAHVVDLFAWLDAAARPPATRRARPQPVLPRAPDAVTASPADREDRRREIRLALIRGWLGARDQR